MGKRRSQRVISVLVGRLSVTESLYYRLEMSNGNVLIKDAAEAHYEECRILAFWSSTHDRE